MGRPLKNLIGQQFGELTVLEKDNTKQRTYWICQCNCGNIVSVRGDSLVRGEQKSCGCYQNRIRRKEREMIGQVFGQLKVLQLSSKTFEKKDNCAYWDCQCNCGNFITVRGSDLRSGNSRSCGCNKRSRGEIKVISILQEMNISFIMQKSFFDLLGDKNYPLKFDFYLPFYDVCIEYQGL